MGRSESLSLQRRLPDVEQLLIKPQRRMRTGFKELDNSLSDEPEVAGGFVVPSLNILGAEPKIGKSTFVQHIAEATVERGDWVYHLDLENGLERFLRRLLYRRAKISSADLRGKVSRDVVERLESALDWLRGPTGERYLFDDDRTLTAGRLSQRLQRIRSDMNGKGNLLVIIDSLQKLPVNLSKDRRAGIDAWLRALEGVRDKSGAAIILVSELKRPPAGKAYAADGLSFKESGDIEYTCDAALTMSKMSGGCLLDIVWNRDGPLGNVARYELQRPYHEFVEKQLLVKGSVT